MKTEITIIQDDREPDYSTMCFMVDENLKMQRKRLLVGDYTFGDIIVERKTIDDFAQSILDGRIETQVEKMKIAQDRGAKCFIILIGKIKERDTHIHENCLVGKMCSIVLKYGIGVLTVDDDYQFLYCLKSLYKKNEELMQVKE